jgi:hypothetical protein
MYTANILSHNFVSGDALFVVYVKGLTDSQKVFVDKMHVPLFFISFFK